MSKSFTLYQKEWQDYRKKRNLSWMVFYSPYILLVLPFLVFNLFGYTLKPVHFGYPLMIFLVWATLYFVTLSRFYNWKCPKCKERFFTPSFWVTSPILLNKCRSCGLPKYFGSTFYKES